jgi:hypothetical protein
MTLDELKNLKIKCRKGWDGYDAEPINEKSVEYLFRFLDMLPESVSVPELVPESNGELTLVWQNKRRKSNALPRKIWCIIGISEDNELHGFVDILSPEYAAKASGIVAAFKKWEGKNRGASSMELWKTGRYFLTGKGVRR